MFTSRCRVYSAVVACAIGIGAGVARADDATTQQQQMQQQQMQQKIDELESQVKALQQQQAQTQADNTKAVQQVISDADAHSQLLAPMTGGAGYDPNTGFYISSDDGNFYLHPWVLGQFQGVINDRQSIQPGRGGAVVPVTGSHEEDGFEIHNLEIGLNGHIASPRLEYYILVGTPQGGGAVTLADAYGTYRLGDDSPWKVKAGQFPDIVWHESNVGDGSLLTVDRSLASVLVGGATGTTVTRVQGVGTQYQKDNLHGEFALTDGFATGNTTFLNTPIAGANAAPGAPVGIPQNFGMSGRVDYKISGNSWDGYDSLSAKGLKNDLFVVGAGVEWDEYDSFDNIYSTVDATYMTASGWSFFGSFMSLYGDWGDDHSLATTKANAGYYPNFGLIAQVGYMLSPQWEPFFRYDVGILNSRYAKILAYGTNASPLKATDNANEFTGGVNYYLFNKTAKISGDVSFLPDGSPVDATGLGVLANQVHTEWVGRLQFQISI